MPQAVSLNFSTLPQIKTASTQTNSIPYSKPVSTQTNSHLSFGSPRKEKLRLTLNNVKRKLIVSRKKPTKISEKDLFEICKSKYGLEGTRFVEQVKLSRVKNKKGHRFTNDFKKMALKQYYQSPLAHRSLGKDMILPSKSTLQRMVKHIRNDPGLDKFIFKKIKKITENYEQKDKLCLILIDEISIQRNLFYHKAKDHIMGFYDNGTKRTNSCASKILVVMLRSINSNWKQPIGYFCGETFSAEELKDIIYEAVENLLQIDMIPKGVVSDQGLQKLGTLLEITTKNPVFFVNNHKMVYMYDTPHLIKSTRNSFLKYHFEVDGKSSSINHVKYLVDFYAAKSYSPVSKVTETHLNPNTFEKMRVKYAVQLLSRSVSKSLKLLVSTKEIDESALDTAQMIENFDNLFSCLNASDTNNFNDYKNVYDDNHEQFLIDMIEYISKIRLIDKTVKNITKKCQILHKVKRKKMILAIDSFTNMFSEYKNITTECSSYKSFITDVAVFLAELRVNNSSKKNITDDVNITHGSRDVKDTFEFLFRFQKGSKFTKPVYDEIIEFIEHIQIIKKGYEDITNQVLFLSGWQTTINATIVLFKDLKENFQFKSLHTRRIN